MSTETNESVERFPLSAVSHNECKSFIKSIIELGNRAAHDFNVDWDEFRIAATQFCEIVVWYSNTYYSEESE
ncbi:MAG: hypothetical protein ACJZ6A_06585 [Candidatus Poseidoniaceae archaeon]